MNKRIKSLNTGTKRLLLVIGIISSITLSVIITLNSFSSHATFYFDDFILEVILIAGLLFVGFWMSVRIVLWITDGFKP